MDTRREQCTVYSLGTQSIQNIVYSLAKQSVTVSLANSSRGLLNESVATDPQNRSEHCQIKYLRAGFQPGGEPGFNLGKGGDGVRPDPVRIRSSFACGSRRSRRIRHKRHGRCFGPRRGRNRGPRSRFGFRARGCSTGGRAGETRRQGQCRNRFRSSLFAFLSGPASRKNRH